MAEYIEREAAQEVLKRFCEGMRQDIPRYPNAIRLASKDIDEIPAADVVEVKHGRWEYHDCVCTGDGLVAVYACSNCRFCIDEEVFEQLNATDFCNCCGARMDGE